MKKLLSIVIPTHNQKFLKDTINAVIHNQGFNHSIELIIVENPEITQEVTNIINECRNFGFDIVHTYSDLGANRARNKGISIAQSNLIALLDDDCVPHGQWINSILSIHNIYPKIGVFGGSVRAFYTEKKPRWIAGFFEQLLACCDFGEGILDWSGWPRVNGGGIVSANMSFRKDIWDAVGGFDERVGYVGRNLCPGDEVVFILEACDKGKPGRLYVGNMIVYHQIDGQRMSLEWFKRRSYGQGIGLANMLDKDPQNVDKTIEDLIIDNVLPDWNSWCDHHSIMDIRTKLSHEESMRIYISNLITCRAEFFRGFMDFFENKNNTDRKSYKDLVDINPLFTLKVR